MLYVLLSVLAWSQPHYFSAPKHRNLSGTNTRVAATRIISCGMRELLVKVLAAEARGARNVGWSCRIRSLCTALRGAAQRSETKAELTERIACTVAQYSRRSLLGLLCPRDRPATKAGIPAANSKGRFCDSVISGDGRAPRLGQRPRGWVGTQELRRRRPARRLSWLRSSR